jgi:hypothetical protein
LMISRTLSSLMSISRATSSGSGSLPYCYSSWRDTRISLLMVSTMCTGIRMVRA